MRFDVNSAKWAWLRIMKKIVSDHTIAPARPGWLKRSSLVKPIASWKATDFSTSATGRLTKIILGMGLSMGDQELLA